MSYVSISLDLYEKIISPPKSSSTLSLTSSKYHHHQKVGKELMLFQAPKGKIYEHVTALNLPFIIELPCTFEELPAASLVLPGGICETH